MPSLNASGEDSPANDLQQMALALRLAQLGLGWVEPNPLVGCVLVAQGQVIGEGYHAKFGEAHAERAAIANALERGAAARLAGCTAYVTLEPCCHHGKTPPCTEALIEARVGRVVVAMLDPFAQVSGKGLQELVEAGMAVEVGLLESEAKLLNAPYLKRLQSGRPWVIAKWAMSLDGKLATHTGQSQWISSPESRQAVQELRGRVDAILVGSGTALADNPRLVARVERPPRLARRVVADSQLRLPLESQLVQSARLIPTLVWAGPQAERHKMRDLRDAGCEVELCNEADPASRLDALLRYLVDKYQATQVLVEGGAKLLGSLMQLQQIDECDVFVAPKLLGGAGAPSPIGGLGIGHVDEGPRCQGVKYTPIGTDMHINCRLDWR